MKTNDNPDATQKSGEAVCWSAWLGCTVHWSDCSVNNGPAYPAGECDCAAVTARRRWWSYAYHLLRILASFLKMRLLYLLRIRSPRVYKNPTRDPL